jgi:sec-independent protein translocase protein TatA
MFGNLNGWHLVILLVIILLLFGAPRLPALARSLGQSMKIFRSEIKNPEADNAENGSSESAAPVKATKSTDTKSKSKQ